MIIDRRSQMPVTDTCKDYIKDVLARGKGPFTYRPEGRAAVAMSYWEVPERLLDDPDELAIWARRAYAIALAAKARSRRL